MFGATVINFLLSSLYTGSQVATVIVYIRKLFTLDINYPVSERPKLLGHALRDTRILWNWAAYLAVSIKLIAARFSIYSPSVEVLFSDLIVIWRAWAISPERQWIIIIPFILWIGAVGE